MFSSYADEEENVDASKMLTGPKQVIDIPISIQLLMLLVSDLCWLKIMRIITDDTSQNCVLMILLEPISSPFLYKVLV